MYGKITGFDGDHLYITAPFNDVWLLEKQGITEVEIKLIDGRSISGVQRKKAYALFRDISLHTGYIPDEVKEVMKADYIAATGEQDFSLSNCDMTTARRFIDHVVEACLMHDIPCQDSLLDRAEDIARYLYLCLVHQKCCLCGKKAHVHHVDRIGMGANRNEICHEGYQAMALCWKHHQEAHRISRDEFNRTYHVFGIKLDAFLCRKLRLGKRRKAS
jgi:hypothetical protein